MNFEIKDKSFLNYLKSTKVDFERAISDINILDKKRKKRISYKSSQEESYYGDLYNHSETLFNGFLFKIVDLYNGLIASINNQSYASAITISRTLIEVIAMQFYCKQKIIKALENKNYNEIYKLLINFSVSAGITYLAKEYKRVHVNDALRVFADEFLNNDGKFKNLNKTILDYYGFMSELSHPAPSSLLIYSNSSTINKDTYVEKRDSFSFASDRIKTEGFRVISIMFFLPTLINEIILSSIEKEIFEKLISLKNEIILHYKLNLTEIEKLRSLYDYELAENLKRSH